MLLCSWLSPKKEAGDKLLYPGVSGLSKQLSGPAKVDKEGLGVPLPAPIRRVLYLGSLMTSETEEIMTPNPSMLNQLENADAIVYGIGSLYTSICPSLILKVRRHRDEHTIAKEPFLPIPCLVNWTPPDVSVCFVAKEA